MLKFMPIFVTLMNITKAFKPKDNVINLNDVNECIYLMRIEKSILSETLDLLKSYEISDEVDLSIKEIVDFRNSIDQHIDILMKERKEEVEKTNA